MPPYREDATAEEGLKTLVLLCTALEKLGNGLDLHEIRRWLEEEIPAVEVWAVPELCGQPGEIAEAVATSGALRLVLGLCSRDYPQIELHAHARRVGIDPFGAEVVNLGAYCAQVHPRPWATDKAKLLLQAAVARALAFPGSQPDSVKPVLSWNQTVSRRALFTLPPLHYEPVPFIRPEACAVEEGCRVCAMTCPREALVASEGGRMVLDKTHCTGCGACVSVCPQKAINLPGVSPQQIDAQLAALLNTASIPLHPRAILFVCARSAPALERLARNGLSYPAGWLPVEVPCIGMVTPPWLLHCLSMGAAATGVLPCLREDCRFGKREVQEGRVGYCREFLGMLGESLDAVRLLDPNDEGGVARALDSLPERATHSGADRPGNVALFGSRPPAQALLRLAEKFAPSLDRSLVHPYSPVGRVQVEQGCTACEACVTACPTGALAMRRDEEGRALTFDTGLCIACEACVPVCPEKVLRVEKVTDLSRLAQGKLTVYRESEIRCEACGAPVAAGAMLGRIAELLGTGDAGIFSFVTRYCVSCRGSLISGRRPIPDRDGGQTHAMEVAVPPPTTREWNC
ncbi:MAG: 4Fe-4S binding protein [Candidatus Methylomirabilales bacterium]